MRAYEEETRERIRTRATYVKLQPAKAKCPSGKRQFSTKKQALGASSVHLKRGDAAFLRIYKCPFCRDFHLTSKEQSKRN